MFHTQTANQELKSLSNFELDLLKQEHFFLQTTIKNYNKQIWVIKVLVEYYWH